MEGGGKVGGERKGKEKLVREKGHKPEDEEDEKDYSVLWFSLQMSTIARPMPGWVICPVPSRPPMKEAGAKALDPSSSAFHMCRS